MSYTNPILLTGGSSAQSIYSTVETPLHPVGSWARLPDGREYVYVTNRSSAIATGKLVKYNEVDTAYDLCVVPTQAGNSSLAIGSTQIDVTLAGSSTIAANQFAGEFLNIDDDTGEGTLYKIFGNTAVAAGTAITLNIEPLRVAITTSTTVTLVNCFQDVRLADNNATQKIAGVTQFAVGAGSTTPVYFWLQRKGLCSVLMNGTPAVGAPLGISLTTGGAVDAAVEVDTAGAYKQIVGTMVSLAGVSTEHHVAWINV
jgi:hypothetical protein